jgi:hypothetical protein
MLKRLLPFIALIAIALSCLSHPIFVSPAAAQTSFSSEDLPRRMVERRAVEAALRGMPIVAADAIHQNFLRDVKPNYYDIVYFSKPADWRVQTTTPDASSYYLYSVFTTKEGPVVLEVPPRCRRRNLRATV